MEVTLKGSPLTVEGKQPTVGMMAPIFTLKNLQDQSVSLESLLGQPVILSVVPDIDTRICQLQTKRFNQEAGAMHDISFATISNNTKEQQANWCAAEGVDMEMLHDPDNRFGKAYGLYIPEANILARAIFVLNKTGEVVYEEIVSEIAQEPDYNQALTVAKELLLD